MFLHFSKLIFLFIISKTFIMKLSNADFQRVEIEIKNVINTQTTRIEGIKQQDWLGGEYFAFRGIPYAKPPIGELRFKDPQPLANLPSYIDARYDGHDCPSIYATNSSENCLILNVYTKHFKPSNNKPLPVLCFIHPGGLYLASSLSTFIDATYLLAKPLVLVTFNYRLASMGFLNLGTKDIPGNAGFKDQVYALRWIQNYIKHFGGNTADVTLMGYSAGGLSVSLHLTAPMSKGLFQKAIVMSGVLPPQTILPQFEQIQLAKRQALKLKCDITSYKLNQSVESSNLESEKELTSILNCLNNFTGTQIAATLRSMFHFGKDHPLYLWLPVIERNFEEKSSRFLTDDFYKLIKSGDFERVPLLIGFVDGEFCTAAGEILSNEILKKKFHAEFERIAPFVFMYENSKNLSFITKSIEQHYKGLETEGAWSFDTLCNAISDALIRFGAYRLSKLAAKYVDVYNYKFVYNGGFTNLNFQTEKKRVEHLDDLMYLFRMPQNEIQATNNQTNATKKIIELYTNFVWDFIENGKISTNSFNFPKSFTLINETLIQENGTNFGEDEATFWEELFP